MTAGEIAVHIRGERVVAVNGEIVAGLAGISTSPTLLLSEALLRAQQFLARDRPNRSVGASLSAPRLELFNRGVLDDRPHPTRLAWFIEATGPFLREYIWVDALNSTVLLSFSQLTDAKSRQVYDATSTATLPGTLKRSEGEAAIGDADVDNAYDFAGDTYDYFFATHGRDSFDGTGAAIIQTVDYCPSPGNCPYANAFWNGSQMVYGDGYASADDVVGHELVHAVTQNSADLFYYMQSGALNESFSDIFGEAVDLGNAAGTDTAAVRWAIGEDLPIGALRNMSDPTLLGHPGKLSDAVQFVCNQNFDDGGVHINSGVPNHAFALVVDGGNYNGVNAGRTGTADSAACYGARPRAHPYDSQGRIGNTRVNAEVINRPASGVGRQAVRRVSADPESKLRVKPIPSWNSPRLLMAYAAFFFDVVVSIFSSRFNASRSVGRCR